MLWGTQKNCYNEMALFEHPKHMLKLTSKKIFIILSSEFYSFGPINEQLHCTCFSSTDDIVTLKHYWDHLTLNKDKSAI